MYYNEFVISKSYLETIELGEKLGKMLEKDSVIVLNGDLASGKTTLTKGIGKGLDIKDTINSPTFTILKIYNGRLPLYHIDAYRLDNSNYDLGFNELDDGVIVVEWPEYYKDYLPKEYIEIDFKYIDEDSRDITIKSVGDKYSSIIKELNV